MNIWYESGWRYWAKGITSFIGSIESDEASFSPPMKKLSNFSKHGPETVRHFNIKRTTEEVQMKYVAPPPSLLYLALRLQ